MDSEKPSKTFRYRLSGQVRVTTIATVGRAKQKREQSRREAKNLYKIYER